MYESLEKLSDEYLNLISEDNQTNYKPIIDKFFEYILEEIETENYNKIRDMKEYFDKYISRQTIIQAGAHYVNTAEKVKRESAIKKYLRFFSDFQKKIIDKYSPHSPARTSLLLTSDELFNEIKIAAGKELEPSSSNIHVDAYGYKYLLDYISKNKPNENSPRFYKNFLINTAFRLFLLYGFKRETILNMKKGSVNDIEKDYDAVFFNKNERVLIINDKKHPIKLELPYALAIDLMKLESESPSPIWIFANEKAQQPTTSYFELIRVKRHATKYAKEHSVKLDESSFTLEGMAKYGIINMLIADMNPMLVKRITGAKDDVLDYCQHEAMKLLAEGHNSGKAYNGHINSRIRSILTYDDFTENFDF